MKTKTTTLNFEYGPTSETEEDQLLTLQDRACFEEIHEILRKHQALNRFGISLLDKDDLSKNCVRLETNSIKKRTLSAGVIENNSFLENAVETNWHLNSTETIAICNKACEQPRGLNQHDPNPDPDPSQGNQ